LLRTVSVENIVVAIILHNQFTNKYLHAVRSVNIIVNKKIHNLATSKNLHICIQTIRLKNIIAQSVIRSAHLFIINISIYFVAKIGHIIFILATFILPLSIYCCSI
jgi:hypothetical protein